jgi:hypothetical protein
VVGFHLRYDLTTIHDKSCARDLHFFTLLFPYYYFIFLMFERFDSYYVSLMIHCIIMHPISRTSRANPTSILHSSYINPVLISAPNPVYILHQSCVYPAPNPRISVVGFHLRYDLTTIHDKSCTPLYSPFYYIFFLMFEKFTLSMLSLFLLHSRLTAFESHNLF